MTSLLTLCATAHAQDFSLMVADPNPLGLGAFVPTGKDLDLGIKGKFKGDLHYGIGIQTVYNSNFFQSENDAEGELSVFLSPWIRYVSDPEGGAKISVVANYTPTLRTYQENSDLNGFDQAGDITLSFIGGKTRLDVFGRYQELSGTDRLSGEFIQGTLLTTGLRANRQIAPRTNLNAGFSYAISDYGSGGSVGAEVFTAYFGGLWEATPRISIGSTLRHTTSESSNTGTRNAWALLMEARYKVGEKLWLSASLGPEYAQNSGDGGDGSSIGITGDLTARYVINDRWSWINSLRSATVPSPSEANYLVNNVAFTTTLQRELLRGSFNFGLEYNYSEYDGVGDVTTPVGDEQNMSVFVNYNRKIFRDRVDFRIGTRYTVDEADTNWSQWQVSCGLLMMF